MTNRITLLFVCSMLFSAAHAATIYQWVDDQGHTQLSDIVPSRYKDVAIKVDTSASRVSEKQRQEALERVAKEKQQVKSANRARVEDAAKAGDTSTLPQRPSPLVDSKNADCEQLMRAYRESQECFAPYMRVEGGTREEAYKYCTSVPDPSSRCGLQGELPNRRYR